MTKYSTNGARRWVKKQRMAKMYRDFFANPKMQERIRTLKLAWCVDLNPRLVRDRVLGTRS